MVCAVASVPKIPYLQYGGKSSIANCIVSFFPGHRVYLEPFCGSCAVLFAKPKSFVEIVNDLDGRIINMFEQLRSRPEELAALLWATPYSKENWREPPTPPDLLEDARLLLAEGSQYFCGGQKAKWCPGASASKHKPRPSVWADNFLRILPAAARLREAIILNEDAIVAIDRVSQNAEALIYVDPPYLGHEDQYRFKVDYARMAGVLNTAKAKIVVSEYAAAERFFGDWNRVNAQLQRRDSQWLRPQENGSALHEL